MGLKVKHITFGIKQESENWFGLLETGLESGGYHQSQVDPSVFYRKTQLF